MLLPTPKQPPTRRRVFSLLRRAALAYKAGEYQRCLELFEATRAEARRLRESQRPTVVWPENYWWFCDLLNGFRCEIWGLVSGNSVARVWRAEANKWVGGGWPRCGLVWRWQDEVLFHHLAQRMEWWQTADPSLGAGV